MGKLRASGKKWIILTDASGEPQLTLDADGFLRASVFDETEFSPLKFCHRPIVIRKAETLLGEALTLLKVYPKQKGDDVIDEDIILFWGDEQRVITGSDVLGRLLRGIVQQKNTVFRKSSTAT